jgi:hypothetical protein
MIHIATPHQMNKAHRFVGVPPTKNRINRTFEIDDTIFLDGVAWKLSLLAGRQQ